MAAHGAGRRSRQQTWREVVRVRARYQRSIHLERDASQCAALDGYLLTPLVRTLTGHICEGFRAGARAWSITGPYGTGKSAFALFLADLFCPPQQGAQKVTRRLLATADPPLARLLAGPGGLFAEQHGLCPVLATGERRPLDQVLLFALQKVITTLLRSPASPGVPPHIPAALATRVATLAEEAVTGHPVPARAVVTLLEQVASELAASTSPFRGLLVVLDEAGKVLEHAAHHPHHGDVQLLQELAEAAHRSGDTPILFVVVLHQAIEHYAGRLPLIDRSEWAKVQGRFRDLPFQGASHEMLRLAGEALDRDRLPTSLRRALAPIAATCARLVQPAGQHDPKQLEALLAAAFPLHPVTALLLGPLFRSHLAQNERSLFSFLASVAPFGFQEHLGQPLSHQGRPTLFLPDTLFDHVRASQGSRLHGHIGKAWAMIETALQRLPVDAGALEARLIKTVGLLGVFGDAAGLVASDATLEAIYTDGTEESRQVLASAMGRLRRASLIVHRKHRGAHQLREGSDLDVDELVRAAPDLAGAPARLVQRLARTAPPRPLVARRHLFETGTFRYFDLRYVDASALDQCLSEAGTGAAGRLLVVIDSESGGRERVLHQLGQPMTWVKAGPKPVIVAVPRRVGRLLELAAELSALEWVQLHTPDLNDDIVARREVATRIAETERLIRDEVARLLGGGIPGDWLTRDQRHEVGSARALARLLSDVCDKSYSKAPVLHNELLNRQKLSTTAAGARRALVHAMMNHEGEARLGIEGTPPEMSMYLSLLERHGLHRERDGAWAFGAPFDGAPGSLRPVWAEIEATWDDARETRLRVPALFDRLRAPPYGLEEGVLPVLLVAAMLAHGEEIALYEDGAFVAAPAGPEMERLLRDPGRFEVQRFAVTGPRRALCDRLGEVVLPVAPGTRAQPWGVLPIVRQLVRGVRGLTDFARATRTISATAQAVREALLRVREPARLLFHDLPVACGAPPFEATGDRSETEVDTFAERLGGALRELRFSYTAMLSSIEITLRKGLHLPIDPDEMRREVAERARALLPAAVDPQLKAFLLRVNGDIARREDWLVSVGTLLGGKPPATWNDRDIDEARVTLGSICRRFSLLEAALVGSGALPVPGSLDLLRIAVARPGHAEQERVVVLRPADAPLIGSLCDEVRAVTGSLAPAPNEAVLAALVLVLREAIAELNDPGTSLRGERYTHVHE